MKQIYLLTILSIINFNIYSQVHYSASINFETNSQLVEIDTNQTNNVWQIGSPVKVIFDSAYSNPFVIITDTLNNYPINNLSSFQVKIIPPSGSCWGIGLMTFVHKYDFDLNNDGGFIEVKYDNDTNWTNIILDTDPEIFASGNNFYTLSDTIRGNIPAFTGTSNDWVYSQFNWAWQIGVKSYYHDSLTIRFSTKSDSIETNQEGWMIDNIYLQLDDCTGNIELAHSEFEESLLYPNPVMNELIIENNYQNNCIIELSDIFGQLILKQNLDENTKIINLSKLKKGTYILKINNQNYVQKIIKM